MDSYKLLKVANPKITVSPVIQKHIQNDTIGNQNELHPSTELAIIIFQQTNNLD